MPKKLKLRPFELPRHQVGQGKGRLKLLPSGSVTSNTDSRQNPVRFHGNERFMFQHWAAEKVRGFGAELDFFHQEVDESIGDPLYGEPSDRVWSRPYKLMAWVSWASSAPVTGEEGFRLNFRGRAWIPMLELERMGAPAPFEGDVVRFWNLPFLNESGVAGADVPNGGYFFDITNADNDGHINDSPYFTGIVCDLVRRSEFGAERRILPP